MVDQIKIRRNSLFSFLSTIARVTANFILFWLIARYYNAEIFGQFTFAQTISTNLLFLADFGFDILLITEVSRNKSKAPSLFQKYYSIKFVFTIVALICMWLIALFIPISFETRILIFLFSFFMVFSALSNFIFAFFKGYEILEYEAYISFGINLILIISVLTLIYLKASIILIGIFFIISRVMGFGAAIIYLKKINEKVSFILVYDELKNDKNKILVYGLFLLFNNLFFQIDTLLLGIWKGEYEVGIYQSVFKLILLPLIIPDIFTNALMPTLSRLFSTDLEKWKVTGFFLNKFLAIIAVPISLIFFVFPDKIIVLLYGGEEFLNSIPVLRILAITFFLRFSFEAFSLMLTTSNRISLRMWTVITATILNIFLNHFFISKYGALGAAIVSLISNSFVLLMYFFFLRNLVVSWLFNVKQFLFYTFSFSMFVLSWYLKETNFLLLVSLILIVWSLYVLLIFLDDRERKLIFSTELGKTFLEK